MISAVIGSFCLLVIITVIFVLRICKNQRKGKGGSRYGIDNPTMTPVTLGLIDTLLCRALICNSGKTLKAFFNIPQKLASIICGVIGKINIFYLNFQDDFLYNGRLHYENDRYMTCRSSDISSPFYGKRWYPGYNEMAANGTWQQQPINNMKYLIPRPKY